MAVVKTKSRVQALCLLVVLGVLLGGASAALAQALPVASKTMDISAFGGFQYDKPDFGQQSNTGGTVGLNVTRYIHLPIAPSLEIRGNYSSGPNVTQKSLLAGIRGQFDRGRFHPYADFLFGGCSLRYDHNLVLFHPDRGSALSYGGGVDIDLVKHFQAKLDVQSQSFNLGPNSVAKSAGGDYTLSPTLFVVGISYRVPFAALYRH